jgi:hypothetical protein
MEVQTIEGEIKKRNFDRLFRLIGFTSYEDAQEKARLANYEYTEESFDKIRKKLKREGHTKDSQVVIDTLRGFVFKDKSKEDDLKPKLTTLKATPEERLSTGFEFKVKSRNWQSYRSHLEREFEKRCEKIV